MEEYSGRSYLQKLEDSARDAGSIVCMGLDPVLSAIPDDEWMKGFDGPEKIFLFYQKIFNRMADMQEYPGAFKFNQGFYEIFDEPRKNKYPGSNLMARVMSMIENRFPGIPIILDYKRGDIGKSSANYAIVGYDNWGADAVTISGYMGTDSVEPFAKYSAKGKGLYVLDRTSNPGATDFQTLRIEIKDSETDGVKTVPLYMLVSGKILKWNDPYPGVGAVIGASTEEAVNNLEEIARSLSNISPPLLIPGVGDQGGAAGQVADVLRRAKFKMSHIRINSSSGLTHPWKRAENAPKDWDSVVVYNLIRMNRDIGYKD